ncbi:MAG: DUF222 domain-containing protein, partial [Acidimicrobiaceae bacterium]|nr:DUF222 domain-containing protein [Acidimicrobiaceae bacterium]
MILEAARRAETAAAALLAAVNTGTASTAELRRVLTATRSVTAAVGAAQTAAAEQIARRERHGDGGAEILAASAGLSQQEARSQVATATALHKVPELRDAVQAGDVPQANARRLVDAITRTGSAAVGGDAELLAQAQSMRPEQFARTAQRWIGAHQADDGTAEYLRQRAKRYLRMHDTEDGMVRLHGEFDKITGTRLRNRLRHTASRLFDADKKLPQSERREFPQCMADALQHFADRASTRAVDGRSQNTEASSRSRRSTGFGSDVSNSHNPAKEAANNSTHSSTDATNSNRTGGDHSDRRSGDTANNNNPVSGITGSSGAIAGPDSTGCGCAQHSHSTDAATSAGPGTDPANGCRSGARTSASIHNAAENTANSGGSMSAVTGSGGCGASACRGDTVATVHECVTADSTSPAAGSSTDDTASTNNEDTNSSDPNTDCGNGDIDSSCAQCSHSPDAATSTGPGTAAANGCRSGARTSTSIHSTAADTANNASSASGITGSGCGASACRGDTVATVHECVTADSTSPAAGSSTDDTASTNNEDTNSSDPNTDCGNGDIDSSCAQCSHSPDAATSAGPGTAAANGGSSGARTGASIHSTAADTANNDNPVSGITGCGCDASACRRDYKVATVHEHGDADSTSPAAGSSTNAAASASSTDPGNA